MSLWQCACLCVKCWTEVEGKAQAECGALTDLYSSSDRSQNSEPQLRDLHSPVGRCPSTDEFKSRWFELLWGLRWHWHCVPFSASMETWFLMCLVSPVTRVSHRSCWEGKLRAQPGFGTGAWCIHIPLKCRICVWIFFLSMANIQWHSSSLFKVLF